ncbi:hypothetical protein BKA61DRAFT_661903 [Leptodontidium sp. MPI-SDFR-AT-0119]|nr:hypothetical protein BKA61DRAFT_661903 [Leptodontidium sp. MPI-SDFR-AT-0119]
MASLNPFIISLFTALYFIPALSISIYIDTSCTSNPSIGGKLVRSLQDVQLMGQQALQRTASDADTGDMPYLFQRIFSAPRSNPFTRSRVDGVNAYVASLEIISDRAASDVRIYCDNDNRWQQHPLNSHPDDIFSDLVYDPINKMVTHKNGICVGASQGTNTVHHSAATGRGRVDDPTENPGRATVVLCQKFLDEINRWSFTSLTKDGRQTDWAQYVQQNGPDSLKYVPAHTLFHELAHASDEKIVDKGYGWSWVKAAFNDFALQNADSYAFYGDFSIMPGVAAVIQSLGV